MIDVVIALLILVTAGLAVTAVFFVWMQVPFIPTPPHIATAMMEMVAWKGGETVMDLGAGDGRLLEAVKKTYPGTTVIGCEIVPTVWLFGVLKATLKRSGVQLHLRSLFREDVSKADVVFLYLFPEVIEKVKSKLDRELKPGTMVICQTFGFNDRVPVREVRVPRWGSKVSVFLYRWPQKVV